MKHTFLLIICVLVGGIGWSVGGRLSPDAMGMAIGMLFGIMAGIPTVLILLAAQKNAGEREQERRPGRRLLTAEERRPPAVQTPQTVNNYNVQISSIRPYEGPWQPTLDEKEALEQKRQKYAG